MDMNQLFSGAMMLSVLTYIGFQLKNIPTLIYDMISRRIIYTVNIDESDILFGYLEKWLVKNHGSKYKNVRAKCENNSLVVQHHTDTFYIEYENKYILITKERDKFENARSFDTAFFNNYRLQGVWAKKQITKLLNEAIDYARSFEKKKQYLYVNGSAGNWMFFNEVRGKTMESVILKCKSSILEDIDRFVKSEEWYLKRGLNYRRSYMLKGSPGNGKTSFAIALAKYLNRDIYFLNLGDLSKDASLFLIYQDMPNNAILVMEDVDRVLNNNKKISISALLNCMDGILSKHGLITIINTNHPENIDEAILRPGRIDKVYEIDNPSKEQVEEYLSMFYDKPIKLANYIHAFSMAKVQELCLSNNLTNIIKLLDGGTELETGLYKRQGNGIMVH